MCPPFSRSIREIARIPTLLVVALAVLAASAWPGRADDLRIAMVLWRGETPAEAGFKEGLKKLGYTAEYVVVDAGQDRAALRSKFEKVILPGLENFDYVYSFGTTASKMTQALIGGQVPQLFNIVADPVKASIVQSLAEPGRNISGASNSVPLPVQIQTAMELFKIKRLGLLFNPRENNSMIQREELKDLAVKRGFEVIDLRSPPALDTLQQNLTSLDRGTVAVDAVYLPADSFLISESKLIGASLRTAKIKSIGAIETFVTNGALLGMVPNYQELGEAVARILHRNREGEALGHIPVYLTQAPALVVNTTTAAALSLEIPEAVLSKAVLVR